MVYKNKGGGSIDFIEKTGKIKKEEHTIYTEV